MPRITGGEVGYGRTVKTGDFENARCDVKLSFSVDDGEDHLVVLNHVAALAQAKALEMVGLRKAGAAAAPAGDTDKDKLEAKVRAELAAKEAATTEKKKPGRPPKTQAADAAAVVDEPKANISVTPEDRKDPAAIDDGLGDVLGTEAATPPITDADLNAKIAKHNEKIKNPVAIRQLIAQYAGPPPKRSIDIPADRRSDFLEALVKL